MDQWLILLRDWQTLVGAVIVASALVYAVTSGLVAERRRRREEARVLRVALGAELRQMARQVLLVHEDVLKLLPPANPHLASPPRTVRDLQNVVRFPDAVVYAQAAAGLGALREHAWDVVNFYHWLWRIQDGITRFWTSSSPEYQMVSVASAQLFEVAGALLGAVEAVLPALDGLAQRHDRAEDEKFKADYAKSLETFVELKKRYGNRL